LAAKDLLPTRHSIAPGYSQQYKKMFRSFLGWFRPQPKK
jgi:hypothetical protein